MPTPRIRILSLLCIALLTSASALAAGVPDLRGNSFPVTGVYTLTFNLNLATQLPAGTTIRCRARVTPNQPGLDLQGQQLSATPVSTGSGQAQINGATATCTEEIPFSWTVLTARGGVILRYEIDAVSNFGSIPLVIRTTGPQNVGLAFPATGTRANLNFNLTF